jgi:nicotinamide-nucleotide amidase
MGRRLLQTLEERLIARLNQLKCTLGLAESCTGGLLAGRVTDVPGASSVFLGGVVAYANEVKQSLLGVPAAMLVEHGAVSQPVAAAMAAGVRSAVGTDYGAGITGIAGPGGGTAEKPVGLVYIGVSGPGGATEFRHVFAGDREAVRAQAVNAAIEHLLELVNG